MEIIKAEDAENMLPLRQGRSTRVSTLAAQLKMGEVLIIPRSEWKRKKPPYEVIKYLEKKTGRKFIKGRTPDGTGWAVKRIA